MRQKCIFILGGARSGKSSFALKLAQAISDRVLFVATAEVKDEEMAERVQKHKTSRPPSWQVLEAPSSVGRRIGQEKGFDVVIIDCLSLLVSNLLIKGERAGAEERVSKEIQEIKACIESLDATFIIVSNEVGMSLVPSNKLGRVYRDLLGWANQVIANFAQEVYLTVSGLHLRLK
jgi:adenosylcobinamide kinase/adenosylcobinamide-phosphate guanylyltransferase